MPEEDRKREFLDSSYIDLKQNEREKRRIPLDQFVYQRKRDFSQYRERNTGFNAFAGKAVPHDMIWKRIQQIKEESTSISPAQ